MGESKVWKSEEIPRQPQQELNAQAIVDTIAEAEAAIAQAEAIIAEIERVVTMAEEARRRAEDAPVVNWVVFESARMGRFIPQIVADMRSMMSLFVAGLSCQSSKEGNAAIMIGYMDLARLMIHSQQVEEDKLKDKEEFKNKKAKTSGNEFRQQKSSANRIAQRGSKPAACTKCGRNHSWMCCDSSTGCFKCGENGHFMRKCLENRQSNGKEGNKAQSSSVASPDRATLRGATLGTGGGTYRLYAINSHQEKKDSPDVVTVNHSVFPDMLVFLF
ncbi:uncharacterized protein LOC125863681 [Solanum stenotomum]|uniref:uncharacterized protein LOC125863681 n=1 Tax=Solanum stenotomum TaxID=172797 RepID=UPI0020D1389A|nr:uncharacterized protein LOC125863681 [Solanum stenotomum]